MALIHAYRASAADKLEAIKQIETQLYARTLIETTRKTQIQSGRALLMVAQSTWEHPQLSALDRERALNQFYYVHPIVFGVVGNITGLTITDTALAFLQFSERESPRLLKAACEAGKVVARRRHEKALRMKVRAGILNLNS